MKDLLRKLTVFAVLITTLSTNSIFAQQGDAFFLVDVSGSMRSSQANAEARQIVLELLQGGFSLSTWQAKGWKAVNSAGSYFSNPSQAMLREGGKFCLMPFGNMLTVRDYKMTSYSSSTFPSFYNSAFPTSHSQQNTYLTLAKAYSVVLARNEGLQGKTLWLIVYSDGMGDSMNSNAFPDDLQEAWDQYGATPASLSTKKGVLRKSANKRNYDIEVWTMGPIPSVPKPVEKGSIPSKKFKITSPQSGTSEKTAIEHKKNEDISLNWTDNIGSVSMTVQLMQSGNPVKIDSPKESYTKNVGASSAKITFHKGGTYKVILKDEKMNSDTRYFLVKSSFPVMPVLLILLVVAGGIVAYRYFDSKRRKVFEEKNEPTMRNSPASTRDSDWE